MAKAKTKLLFICTGNHDRSPTAEDLFRNSKDYEARSAGTSVFATCRVTQELIDWANKIFVMSELEDGHLTFLETHFNIKGKAVYDLDIPDRYERGSQELINLVVSRHQIPSPITTLLKFCSGQNLGKFSEKRSHF